MAIVLSVLIALSPIAPPVSPPVHNPVDKVLGTLLSLAPSGATVTKENWYTLLVRSVIRTKPVPSRHRASPPSLAADLAEHWAHTPFAKRVSNCESDGDPQAVNGKYTGKWQNDADFWSTYGGLAFAPSPLGASILEQDIVAYRGWLDRGWEPWSCATIVG